MIPTSTATCRVITPAAARSEHARRDWRHQAACRNEDPELFFPVGSTGVAQWQAEEAKAVCRRCPVLEPCARWALETRQEHGVWGGMSPDDRHGALRRAARKRQKEQKEQGAPEWRKLVAERGPQVVALYEKGRSTQSISQGLNIGRYAVTCLLHELVPETRPDPAKVADRLAGRSVELTEAEVLEVIIDARRRGMTWSRIDALLGVSDAQKLLMRARKVARQYGLPVPGGRLDPPKRLARETVVAIREEHAAGASTGRLALKYGIRRETVLKAVTGKTWPGAGGPLRSTRGPMGVAA